MIQTFASHLLLVHLQMFESKNPLENNKLLVVLLTETNENGLAALGIICFGRTTRAHSLSRARPFHVKVTRLGGFRTDAEFALFKLGDGADLAIIAGGENFIGSSEIIQRQNHFMDFLTRLF